MLALVAKGLRGLASKIEAFLDRGKEDFVASPDIEDMENLPGHVLDIANAQARADQVVALLRELSTPR